MGAALLNHITASAANLQPFQRFQCDESVGSLRCFVVVRPVVAQRLARACREVLPAGADPDGESVSLTDGWETASMADSSLPDSMEAGVDADVSPLQLLLFGSQAQLVSLVPVV